MGAKLGKIKTLSISGKSNQTEKTKIVTSNNHSNKTTTLEKQFKKKKEKTSNAKADKYTDTADGTQISLPYSIKLCGVSRSNNRLHDVHNAEVNSINQFETSNKDILEFREACLRRGIISQEMNTRLLLVSSELNNQANTVESIAEISPITITNNETLENQQAQVSS